MKRKKTPETDAAAQYLGKSRQGVWPSGRVGAIECEI